MVRKLAVTLAAFALVCACVLGAGALAEPATALRPVEAASPCPAAGLRVGGVPRLRRRVPGPTAPTRCGARRRRARAWSATRGTRWWAATARPSDASLNVWVLMPVALAVGLVLVVKALSKGGAR